MGAVLVSYAVSVMAWAFYHTLRAMQLKLTIHGHRVNNSNGRYIYVFHAWGNIPAVKMGETSNMRARSYGHNTSNPLRCWYILALKVPDSHKAEAALLARFAQYKVTPSRGRGEWFWLMPDLLLTILVLRSSMNEKYLKSQGG